MITFQKDIIDLILPRKQRDTFKWITENLKTKDGKAFSRTDYPWLEGICREWDNPKRSTFSLQWASRIGKTTTAHALMISAVDFDPRPFMQGQPTEQLCRQQIRDKIWPMFAKSPTIRHLLPRKMNIRKEVRLDLKTCTMWSGWSGSSATLADKDPVLLHGGEIDKWSFDKSIEADPVDLFCERGAERVGRRIILESSPTLHGHSRINKRLTDGTNCTFQVACPSCGGRQELRLSDSENKAGGLKFDREDSGKLNPALARKTAYYECEHCEARIEEFQRRPMVRTGVWCPAGCSVDDKGRITGTPIHDGPDFSCELSRLYAPTFRLGDVAAEYAKSWEDLKKWRNFLNSWMGKTVRLGTSDLKWEELGEKLALPYDQETIHDQVAFLTCGVDVQDNYLVYVVIGWTPLETGYVVDYGVLLDWDELKTTILNKRFRHLDGGDSLHVAMTLIDARDGNRTDEVIDFCASVSQHGRWVWPCMGTHSGHMSGKPFIKTKLREIESQKKRRIKDPKYRNIYIVKVNTNYWQDWIYSCLERRRPGDPKSLGLPREAIDDQDLLEQLLNEQATGKPGHQLWVPISEHAPQHYRDTFRYARCAAEVFCNGNWKRVRRRGGVAVSASPSRESSNSGKSDNADKNPPLDVPDASDDVPRGGHEKKKYVRQLKNRRIGRR